MRVVCWFSCGAASAVTAKLAIEQYGAVDVVYCDTMSTEHPDQQRFFDDVQRWLGQDIIRIKSEKYTDVDDVFDKHRYLAGIAGARCTVEMKKVPRFAYQRPDDLQLFGYHKGEDDRAKRLVESDPGVSFAFPLIEQGLSKGRCRRLLTEAGIELPAMYGLGYTNNNCLGCVKATSFRYWQGIRHDFPEVFERRVQQSRELDVRLTRFEGKRIFLDELPEGYKPSNKGKQQQISCGPECAQMTLPLAER